VLYILAGRSRFGTDRDVRWCLPASRPGCLGIPVRIIRMRFERSSQAYPNRTARFAHRFLEYQKISLGLDSGPGLHELQIGPAHTLTSTLATGPSFPGNRRYQRR